MIQQAASATGISPLHQLPPPPDHFTGREDELAYLEQQLSAGEAAGATIAGARAGLQGMGGVGKSALAVVLAHRFKARYPDAQLYLNLRGAGADPVGQFSASGIKPLSPAEAMQNLIHAFRPEARLPETLAELTPRYHSVLNGAGRVLLLLDNAASAEQVKPLLPPPNCLLLVTSRAQFQLPGLATRNLDCLPPDKTQALLCRLAVRFKPASAEVKDAAELCGRLPLALEVFAGAVNDRSLTPLPELLARLRNRQDRLSPVDAAFEVSYELLSEALRRCWRLLAVFPASFDLRAAAAVWGLGGAGDSPAPAGNLPDVTTDAQTIPPGGSPGGTGQWPVPPTPDSARDVMQSLVNASLAEWNRENDRFRLHDLVRQFCEGKLGEDERIAARLHHAGHYRDVGREAQKLYLKGGENMARGLELFDRERVHLEAAFEFLSTSVGRGVPTAPESPRNSTSSGTAPPRRAEDSPPYLETATLLLTLVGALAYTGNLRFHPRQRIRWLEAQRNAARQTRNREYEGAALNNLGLAYAALGDAREAIAFHEQALVIDREIGDRREEGNALGNLGLAYVALGEAHKAIKFYEQQLVLVRETGDRRGEGNALGSLGNAHSALGGARKAIEFYEQQLVLVREIGDRRGEGNALGNLGNAYFALSNARKAIEFHEQRLGVAREIGDRRGEANALNNLGLAYVALGYARKAIEFHERQLEIVREIGDRRGEAIVFNNLGLAYAALGDVRKAIEFYEQCLELHRTIGDRHGESSALGNLGLAHAASGNARKAIELYEQCLKLHCELGDQRGQSNDLGNLGLAYAALGNARKAIEFYEQCLKLQRETGDRRGEGYSLWNSALAFNTLGDRAQAVTLAEAALKICEAIEDPNAAKVRAQLARWQAAP